MICPYNNKDGSDTQQTVTGGESQLKWFPLSVVLEKNEISQQMANISEVCFRCFTEKSGKQSETPSIVSGRHSGSAQLISDW